MLSFNRLGKLSLAALTLSLAPLAGCEGETTPDDRDGDLDEETVAEAESALGTNLALGKPASQSSTVVGGVASRAVDGNTDGSYWNNSVTHTDPEPHAWWQVDLQSVQAISDVVVWNRTDCCADRLSNFKVLVSSDGANWQAYPYAGAPGQATSFAVNRSARYVKVQLDGTNNLSLAEVQVFSAPSQVPSGLLAETFRTRGGSAPLVSYGRGAGAVPTTTTSCGPGEELNGALCYPACAPGYAGAGPVCWQTCPAGYTDTGAFCQRYAQIISSNNSACPWYDVCGVTFAQGCSSCPPGYINDGCTCRIDDHTFAKSSYGRGAGTVPTYTTSCPSGNDLDAGLCYPRCEVGYKGVGPVCWLDALTFQGMSAQVCDALFDPGLSQLANLGGAAATFGFGAGIAVGASVGAEAGVAYGAQGQFGCYFTTCAGIVSDVSINAWGAFGVLSSFDDVAGDSIVSYAGMSTEMPELPLGIGGAIGVITDTSYQPIGFTGNVSFGVGLSPVQVGVQACHTIVQQTR